MTASWSCFEEHSLLKLSFYLGVFVLKHISDWQETPPPISVARALLTSCAVNESLWLSCLKYNYKFYRTFLVGFFFFSFF